MRPETIQRLDAFFAAHPILVGGSAPQAEIGRAEQRVGMAFDAAYVEFLGRYGGAVVGSLPILGVRRAEVMGNEDYVDKVTARFRADGWKPTDEWVVISVDLAGNPIGLTGAGEVWISDHDAGETWRLSPTFDDFVQQLLEEVRDASTS